MLIPRFIFQFLFLQEGGKNAKSNLKLTYNLNNKMIQDIKTIILSKNENDVC